MVKVKKSLTGIELETDLPEKVYKDARKHFNKDEKEVIALASEYDMTTEQISEATGKDASFIENTMRKASYYGNVKKKKNGKWKIDKRLAVGLVGGGLFLLLLLAFRGGITGAKATMGDLSAGKTGLASQQGLLSPQQAVGDIAGRTVSYIPLQQSPFSAPATMGELGEEAVGQQFSPFSPIRQAEMGDVTGAEGGYTAATIEQEGGQILSSDKEFGDAILFGDQLLLVGDDSSAIQQQMRVSEQGGNAGLVTVDTVRQSSIYNDRTPEEKAILDKYL